MNELGLRGLPFDMSLLSTYSNKIERVDADEEGEFCFDEYIRSEIYINTDKKISVMLEQSRYDDEPFFEDCVEVVNCISDTAYDALINYMKSHDNFTVYWSQIYGTTSDYIIIPMYLDTVEEIKKTISEIQYDTVLKYLIVTKDNNGVLRSNRFIEESA